ncbi:MAG: nitrite reductase small subunit NirD [Bacteroidota bacterium]|nr:nitrite reductase small subunit NirD [Bacteroidota bacterium]
MSTAITENIVWFPACKSSDVPQNGGVCVKYKDVQIALFNFTRRGEWYASQNMCPHRRQMVLSRGMIGSQNDEPKVACPFHKKTFSLIDGHCMSGEEYSIKTYPVKVENDIVYIGIANENENASACV